MVSEQAEVSIRSMYMRDEHARVDVAQKPCADVPSFCFSCAYQQAASHATWQYQCADQPDHKKTKDARMVLVCKHSRSCLHFRVDYCG